MTSDTSGVVDAVVTVMFSAAGLGGLRRWPRTAAGTRPRPRTQAQHRPTVNPIHLTPPCVCEARSPRERTTFFTT